MSFRLESLSHVAALLIHVLSIWRNNLCPGGVSLRIPIVRVVHVVNQRSGLLSGNRQAEIPPFEERIVISVVVIVQATTMVARVRRGGEVEGWTRATLDAPAGGGRKEREGCAHIVRVLSSG